MPVDPRYQAELSAVLQGSHRWLAWSFLLGPRRGFRHLSRITLRVADELSGIVPPQDVKAQHRALVDATKKLAAELDDVARRPGFAAAERFERAADLDWATDASAAIEAKGYRLRPLPSPRRVR